MRRLFCALFGHPWFIEEWREYPAVIRRCRFCDKRIEDVWLENQGSGNYEEENE